MLRRAFSLGMAGYACVGMKAHAQPACDPLQAAADRFQQLAEGLRRLAPAERHAAANRHINALVDYAPDLERCGARDCWQTPAETLASGRGDCEDYAIAKYFSLLAVGMPVAKLRLVYVRAQIGGPSGVVQAHMVLAYYATPGAEPMILDNLITDVRPASRRPDLVPVFSFNSEGLWQGVGPQAAGDPAARLSRWREILVKARAEGFQ